LIFDGGRIRVKLKPKRQMEISSTAIAWIWPLTASIPEGAAASDFAELSETPASD